MSPHFNRLLLLSGPALALVKNEGFWSTNVGSTPAAVTLGVSDSASVDSLTIFWSFPAKAFEVSVSREEEGGSFETVYSTNTNILKETEVPIGSASPAKIRITVKEAARNGPPVLHPQVPEGAYVSQAAGGDGTVGIRRLAVMASTATAAVEPCDVAARSATAGDKVWHRVWCGVSSIWAKLALPSCLIRRCSLNPLASLTMSRRLLLLSTPVNSRPAEDEVSHTHPEPLACCSARRQRPRSRQAWPRSLIRSRGRLLARAGQAFDSGISMPRSPCPLRIAAGIFSHSP